MTSRRAFLIGAAASALSRPALAQPGLKALADLARRAAIYAIPLYETARWRWRETVDPANPQPLKLNQLDYAATPAPAAPDTLVSRGWIDLTSGPMFLTVPDMGARSYSFAVVDMFGDTIDHVSRRLYGGRSPPHVLFGPTWTNLPPSGVRAIQATTNLVRLTGRIAVDGPDDLAAARAMQAKVLFETPAMRNERRVLETRELMPAGTVPAEEPIASWPAPRADDPWDLFVTAVRVLGENPVPARDAALLAEFAALRLRPGRRFDLLGFSPAERAAMLDGIDAARAEVLDAAARASRRVGAWRYPPVHPGDFGVDLMQRAVVAVSDPFMPETVESMTLTATTDESGAPLDGFHHYELRFVADGTPPHRAFWSLSIEGQLLGGLRRQTADQAEIALRRDRPGHFAVELRICEPSGPLPEGTWRPPLIVHIQ